MNSSQHVYVAMSGGVDSAVAAARLLSEGYRVTGIHMKTWKDPKWQESNQNTPPDAELAQNAADFLGIPFISLDIREQFLEMVVKGFIRDYVKGLTPNPCLFCNPQVKWGILQSYALEKGADYFATGHYARIVQQPGGKVRLLRGKDRSKDQSYVLSMLTQFQLSRSLLPLGSITKHAVRVQAKEMNLLISDRQESQDLCFLGDRDYRDFLQRFAPDSLQSGDIIDLHGNVLGAHRGLAFYTIGQRKGIRVAAPKPYYVIDKVVDKNQLVVGYADQAGKKELTATQPNWFSGEPPNDNQVYQVMIRYRAEPLPAQLSSITHEEFRLKFKKPTRGITPGQVAVLYQDEEICLGGGVIKSFS